MKLPGPKYSIRFVVGIGRTRAVVCGVFPPEAAPAMRAHADAMAVLINPTMQEAARRAQRELMDHLMYGKSPYLQVPRGVLRP